MKNSFEVEHTPQLERTGSTTIQRSTSTPLETPPVDTASAKQKIGTTPTRKQEARSTPTGKQEAKATPTAKQEAKSTPIVKQEAKTMPTVKQEVKSMPQEPEGMPSLHENSHLRHQEYIHGIALDAVRNLSLFVGQSGATEDSDQMKLLRSLHPWSAAYLTYISLVAQQKCVVCL